MHWVRRLARRIGLVARRNAVEAAMDAEFRHHLDCEIADRIRTGMPPEEARRTALRDFGGIEGLKEDARDARGGRLLEDVAADVAYGARVLRRNPGYTTAAVLTFALAVGAGTAIFSLVYGILLRPLPYRAPEDLVVLWEQYIPGSRDRNVVSLDNYEAWRDRARSFASISAVVPASLTVPGEPAAERVAGAEVTPGYFDTLGVTPALGRGFTAADARDGLTVILSDALWRRRFGADPSIVGRPITLSGQPHTVVGIMPVGFEPPRVGWLGQQHFWLPFKPTEQSRSWGRFLIVIARLRARTSVEHASAELARLASQRASESPGNEGWSAAAMSLAREIVGEVRVWLAVLLVAVGLLLAIAVANVATLTVSMLRRRGEELAIRRAVGATDSRLFRQLLVQSALVGLLGAGVGAATAPAGVRALVALLPPDVPRSGAVVVDAPVLLVTMLVSLVATLVIGVVAAARGCRSCRLTSGGPRDPGSLRTASRAGSGAVLTTEIALAVSLSVMAVLMTRSVAALRTVDLGFEPGGVVVARVSLPESYAAADQTRGFFQRLVERVSALPGVASAGVVSARPFGGVGPATTVHDARRPADPQGRDPVVDVRFAEEGGLAALGIVLPRHAGFGRAAAGDAPRVLVSETLARAVWDDSAASGQTLKMQLFGGIEARVAGVVRDIRLVDARTPPRPIAYLPFARFPDTVCDLVVRVEGDPAAFTSSLRAAAASVDPAVPLYDVTTMSDLVEASLARDRLAMLLLIGFATAAVLLAAIGVYGVFADDVTTRRKEIGIRIALGAAATRVIGMLVGQALARTALGVAAGVAIAAALGRGMQSVLFGVGPADPVSFVAVCVLVTGVAIGATLVPAVRLLRESPLAALREG